MKMQVITYTRTKNYGGVLQAVGLYKHLASLGHDVSFIDYVPERCNVEDREVFVECATSKSRVWGANSLTKKIWSMVEYPRVRRGYLPFDRFVSDNIKLTDERFYSIEELVEKCPAGDLYITGSDQVWNSAFTRTGKPDEPYYLSFTDKRKISYASSFGTESIPDANRDRVRKLLARYDALSTREETGVRILEDMGLAATRVLDPTMLCDKRIWAELAVNQKQADYILLYQVEFNVDTYRRAEEAAKFMKKRLLVVTMSQRDSRRYRNPELCPDVTQWLGLIRDADAVITDSFHAVVFSLLFEIPFLVDTGARPGMSSRITGLLDLLEVSGRELIGVDAKQVVDILEVPYEWGRVRKNLERERGLSRAWLNDAISGHSR